MNKDDKEKSENMPTKSAEDYLMDGDKYRQQKKWLEAVKAYTGAIKLNENDFRSYERRGRCYFEKVTITKLF